MQNVYSYLKNLAYVSFIFLIFAVITFGYQNACEINKEYNRYDSLNKCAKRAQQGNGIQQRSLQDCDSLYNLVRNNRRNINF